MALLENAILREQDLNVVADLQERVAKRPDVVEKLRRQILMDAADPEIVGVHARTRCALIKRHQLLALLEAPQYRGQRADIERLGRHVEEMREQTSDLGIEDPDQLPALGNRDAEKPFGRQAERVLLVHGRHVVEPVEIGQRLQIRLMLDQLFSAAVQEADMGVDALNDLAVKLKHKAKHAVGRGVLGPEVEGEIADSGFHGALPVAEATWGRLRSSERSSI